MVQELPAPKLLYDYSPEYWYGWILAYYQWYTGRSFRNIRNYISMREIRKLYPTLHETAEDKFVDTINRMIQQYEQRRKDINKAAAIHLVKLAQTLGCKMEDLWEQSLKEIE